MSTKELRGDLIAIGAIYLVFHLIFMLAIQFTNTIKLKADLYEAMSVAVELGTTNSNLHYIIGELNAYIEIVEQDHADTLHNDRLLKDLR